MREDVAALFVDPEGPYPSLLSHCWDVYRDARTYDLKLPVVAHPPCQTFSIARHPQSRHTPDQVELGLELFSCALETVRENGGVLEHPAKSDAFGIFGLGSPRNLSRSSDGIGWLFEVNQCCFGHMCKKSTWLYVVGNKPSKVRCKCSDKVVWKDTLKSKRHLTPKSFAEYLIGLATRQSQ